MQFSPLRFHSLSVAPPKRLTDLVRSPERVLTFRQIKKPRYSNAVSDADLPAAEELPTTEEPEAAASLLALARTPPREHDFKVVKKRRVSDSPLLALPPPSDPPPLPPTAVVVEQPPAPPTTVIVAPPAPPSAEAPPPPPSPVQEQDEPTEEALPPPPAPAKRRVVIPTTQRTIIEPIEPAYEPPPVALLEAISAAAAVPSQIQIVEPAAPSLPAPVPVRPSPKATATFVPPRTRVQTRSQPPPAPVVKQAVPKRSKSKASHDGFTDEEWLEAAERARPLLNYREPPNNLAPAPNLHGLPLRQPRGRVRPVELGIPGAHYHTQGGLTFVAPGEYVGDTPIYIPQDERFETIIRGAAAESERRLQFLTEAIRRDPYLLNRPKRAYDAAREFANEEARRPRTPIDPALLPSEEQLAALRPPRTLVQSLPPAKAPTVPTAALIPPPAPHKFPKVVRTPKLPVLRSVVLESTPFQAANPPASLVKVAHIVRTPKLPVPKSVVLESTPFQAANPPASLVALASLVNPPPSPTVRTVTLETVPSVPAMIPASLMESEELLESGAVEPVFNPPSVRMWTAPPAIAELLATPGGPPLRSVDLTTEPITQKGASKLQGSLLISPELPPLVLVRKPFIFAPPFTFSFGDFVHSPSTAGAVRTALENMFGPPPSLSGDGISSAAGSVFSSPLGPPPNYAPPLPPDDPLGPPPDYAPPSPPRAGLFSQPAAVRATRRSSARPRSAFTSKKRGRFTTKKRRKAQKKSPKKPATKKETTEKKSKNKGKKKASKKKAKKTAHVSVKVSSKKKSERTPSKYNLFVSAFKADHPNLKGPELFKAASAAWRKRGATAASATVIKKKRHTALSKKRKVCAACHCNPVIVNQFCTCKCH